MTRDYNFACLEIEAVVSTMFTGIAKKDTFGGAGREFVFGGGERVDVAEAPKDSQVLVARRLAEE
jgi:hypothetical protein